MLENEKILVIGSGGREHALGWKLKQSGAELYFAPGNGGTEGVGQNLDIGTEETGRLVEFARDQGVAMTVVGPEGPLSAGIVDAFREAGLEIFGPTQKAARLESDKAWTAGFLDRHGIPQPQFRIFTQAEEALAFVRSADPVSYVIKASGLCAGKGVILPGSVEEAVTTLTGMLDGSRFGDAGQTVVVQERLTGPELSVMAFTDGVTVVPMLPARDHKRVFDRDQGPNTGGMGAFAPVPAISAELVENIRQRILLPTVSGMREEGYPYQGVLYAGLMMTREGPKVLEYNARFGDPEAQPLLLLLSSDLSRIFHKTISGTLSAGDVSWHDGAAVCVVLTAAGYPGLYEKGQEISLARPNNSGVEIFHAGTAQRKGQLVTAGGRVLGVTAAASTLPVATAKVYAAIGKTVYFADMYYRNDIGLFSEEDV